MHHVAIFASGTGSNAREIIRYFKQSQQVSVSLVVSNKPDAPVLEMAKEHGVSTLVIDRSYFYQGSDILKKLNEYHIDFVVLAGFLWLVPSYLVKAFEGRIINIHPALLPKYGGKGMYGMHVHEAVYRAGDQESGITIHQVNEQYDDGDIVFQAKCILVSEDTPQTIARKVQQLEHEHFPRVIERLLLTNDPFG